MNIIQRAGVLFKQATRNPLIITPSMRYAYGNPYSDQKKMVKEYRNWVYACVNKNSTSVAALDLKLFTKAKGKEEPTEILTHPILDLFTKVNPVHNGFELKMMIMIYLDLTGNSYVYMASDGIGRVRELWYIPSHWTKVVPGTKNWIDRYEVNVPGYGEPVIFTPEEIIHFKYPNPCSLFYGLGPLEAAAHQVELNNDMNTYSIQMFKNNARPDGVLQTPGSLNPEQYERLRAKWNETYKGTENAGKIAILEAGLEYNQISITPKDLDFIEGKRQMRDEILAIFGVPASKLGLVEDVNRANADANDYTYQKETIFPRLILIEE